MAMDEIYQSLITGKFWKKRLNSYISLLTGERRLGVLFQEGELKYIGRGWSALRGGR